ncbi:NADH-quinone oxidoreductase subunit NuoB [Actinomadura roseirufa]|uniref:NADH-quinone oxidoreductase subunit B n=1 Tax=Actinomadura roseirufa TaxID=2094049 RepID=UPI001040EB1B|nr:NADH-quinone oxidoreductase subunit NuoB [Actinomadura roseirufa]
MSTIDLPPPSVGPLSRLAPKPIKFVLNWGRRYSLWVFNFGLACCAIEFIATSMSRHDFIRLGVIPFAPGPRQADLMVVSGTVSDKMAPAVRRLYEQMPEPKYVISFGACSNCGGPYWDSYCVTKGVDQIIPVDVYVPGCPPRPEALLHGIVHLQEKIAGESLGERYGGGEPITPPPPPRPFSATVLRRPLQPPPDDAAPAGDTAPDDAAPAETRPVPPAEDGRGREEGPGVEEAAPPGGETEGSAEATQPVPPVEASAETRPLPPVRDEAGRAGEPEAPAARPSEAVTQPVPPVTGEEKAAEEHPAGETAPPRAGGGRTDGRTRRGRDHDPSIIPGLVEDAHDDQIGRSR